jgi:hypothetical protein
LGAEKGTRSHCPLLEKKSGFLFSIYHRNRGKKSGKYSRFPLIRGKPSVEKDACCGILVATERRRWDHK